MKILDLFIHNRTEEVPIVGQQRSRIFGQDIVLHLTENLRPTSTVQFLTLGIEPIFELFGHFPTRPLDPQTTRYEHLTNDGIGFADEYRSALCRNLIVLFSVTSETGGAVDSLDGSFPTQCAIQLIRQ